MVRAPSCKKTNLPADMATMTPAMKAKLKEEAEKYQANKMARDAIRRELARHQPIQIEGIKHTCTYCSVCWNDCNELSWPCPTVEILGPAEEAINMTYGEENATST